MLPLVTLFTPLYNAAPYLRQYLSSVLAQTWRPLQFILVDDGSDDDSVDIAQSYAPLFERSGIDFMLITISHGGAAAAVNAALQYAKGDFLTWCDADDMLLDESIGKKIVYLREHPELDLVRSDGWLFTADGTKRPCTQREAEHGTKDLFDAILRQETHCYAGSYMIRASAFFSCYTNRQIPLSEIGQNLQLVLPPASRSLCGYIPEQLFSYYIRPQGHSSKKTPLSGQLKKLEDLRSLRLTLLPYCQCDQVYYQQEVQRLYQNERRALLSQAAAKARKDKEQW